MRTRVSGLRSTFLVVSILLGSSVQLLACTESFSIKNYLPFFNVLKGQKSPPASFTVAINCGAGGEKKVNTTGPVAGLPDEPTFTKDWDFYTSGDVSFDTESADGTIVFHPTAGSSKYSICLCVAHQPNGPAIKCSGPGCGCDIPSEVCGGDDAYEFRLEGQVVDQPTNLQISPSSRTVFFVFDDPVSPLQFPDHITYTVFTDGGPESIKIDSLEVRNADPTQPLPDGYFQVIGPGPENQFVSAGQSVTFDARLAPKLVRPGIFSIPSFEVIIYGTSQVTRTKTAAAVIITVNRSLFLPSIPTLGAGGEVALVFLLLSAGLIVLARRRA